VHGACVKVLPLFSVVLRCVLHLHSTQLHEQLTGVEFVKPA